MPLEKCTRRNQELLNIKVDATLKASQLVVDMGSDLKVKMALTRRGLAYDQASLIGFDTHEAWVNTMFRALYRTPPMSFVQPDLQQLLRADCELFVLMAERTRGGLVPTVGGIRPLDTAMTALIDSPDLKYLLNPLPASPKLPCTMHLQPFHRIGSERRPMARVR